MQFFFPLITVFCLSLWWGDIMMVILEALTEAPFWLIFPNHDRWLLQNPESVN